MDQPLYDEKKLDYAKAQDLLKTELFAQNVVNPKNNPLNRCLILALNCLLGGCYFPNLKSYLGMMQKENRKAHESATKLYRQRNELPVPTGSPFAVVQAYGRMLSATLVPVAEFSSFEMQVFMENPIMFEIFFAIRG